MAKMRPIEMAFAKGDGTWRDGIFIEIPDDTPEDKIEQVASKITLKTYYATDIAHAWVYNSMEDIRKKIEWQRRLQLS